MAARGRQRTMGHGRQVGGKDEDRRVNAKVSRRLVRCDVPDLATADPVPGYFQRRISFYALVSGRRPPFLLSVELPLPPLPHVQQPPSLFYPFRCLSPSLVCLQQVRRDVVASSGCLGIAKSGKFLMNSMKIANIVLHDN
jgi:hypothetical protein